MLRYYVHDIRIVCIQMNCTVAPMLSVSTVLQSTWYLRGKVPCRQDTLRGLYNFANIN